MSGSRTVIFLLYALFFIATNWPVLMLANRIYPKVGPFPFLVFWMLFWSIGIGIVHLLYGLCCVRDPSVPERTMITSREEDQ